MSEIHVDRKLSEYAATKFRATAKITDTFPVKKGTCTSGRVAIIVGIEDKVWARTAGHIPVYAIADEDLEQEVSEKTSSVRFLRFELTPEMIRSLHQNATLNMGIDHPAYQASIDAVDAGIRAFLLKDFTIP